jgi:hypothetical protein
MMKKQAVRIKKIEGIKVLERNQEILEGRKIPVSLARRSW